MAPRIPFLKQIMSDYFRGIPPAPQKPAPAAWSDERITLAWLGHATVLMNFFGAKILTDPVLGSRIGLHFGGITLGPKRYVQPALRVHELPSLDLILLTHAHMDHLDFWTLRQLDRDCPVITAKATGDLLRGIGFHKIIELDWGSSMTMELANAPMSIEAFELKHWGARMQHDVHRGFNGYLLERSGRRIFVTGDTAYTDKLGVLRGRGPIDLIVVPIAAYNPWIANHCTPEQAVEMANQAGAHFLMPVHHETFRLSWEPMEEPIDRFKKALAAEPSRIATTRVGETFKLR